MYRAEISILNLDKNSFRVIDESEQTEVILNRILLVRSASGKEKYYTFDVAQNYIDIDDFNADIALEITLTATPQTEDETSTYTACLVYAFINNIEEYILSLNAKIFCNKDCKNDSLIEALDISYNYDGIIRFAECNDLYKTQRLIDYINSYMPSKEKSNCCGPNRCETC